jgi:hypothetical protein
MTPMKDEIVNEVRRLLCHIETNLDEITKKLDEIKYERDRLVSIMECQGLNRP